MWSILFRPPDSLKDRLLLELWERGTCGIVEEADGLRAFFAGEFSSANCPPDFHASDFRREPSVPAQPASNVTWEPLLVGRRFYIAPPSSSLAPADDRIRLEIESDLAFGTGRHETTQLCLDALEELVTPTSVVLDVGCGSGILSRAARLLGARSVFSCDIDEHAIATARRHLDTPLFFGSADAAADEAAGLVIANISAAALDLLAHDLKRVTGPDGVLVISGFISAKLPQFFRPASARELGDWLCWICRSSDISPPHDPAPLGGLSHKAEWWL